MIKIRCLVVGYTDKETPPRTLESLMPYQDAGVEISISSNSMGPRVCNNGLDNALGAGTIAYAAMQAEKEGVDAIVIESGGDSGLVACREAVSIPVVGLTECSVMVAQMLSRKFGLLGVREWHSYTMERLVNFYGHNNKYVGCADVGLPPYFIGYTEEEVLSIMINKIKELADKDADTIIFGGSYFLNKREKLKALLKKDGLDYITMIEQLPIAIRFARMLVECKLTQNKKFYPTPNELTPAPGYPDSLFEKLLG